MPGIDDDDNDGGMASEALLEKIKKSMATIRENLDKIEKITKKDKFSTEDGVMLADSLEQCGLDMEGSLKLLGE